ncbi:hypothetical protein ACEPAF_6889 [Sanghuangporus sanghuang]
MLFASRRTLTERAILFARYHPSARSIRPFVLTANPHDIASLHPSEVSNVHSERPSIAETFMKRPERNDYVATVRREKYKDLLDALHANVANPDLTWTLYVDLLDITRDEPLPLEIHQRVLRLCTREPQALRRALVRRLAERQNIVRSPHAHEGRFLTIVTNIRRAGYVPTLEDYEFILSHFVAVGHHIGAAQVLQEVMKFGMEPRTKTFNLCLQAIAFRLSLPCYKSEKEKRREQCTKLCLHIAGLIRRRKQRIPSVCLDLILRIMKDTENADIFKSLLKVAYGIDLDYLDRHPLPSDDGGMGDPEPFSTAALTTLVDFLGRRNEVSKMVAAFEVLTTPLAINPTDVHLRNFDDDDDDPIPTTSSASRPLPSARPNTTTYSTLLRHCAQRRKRAFTKHYLLRALELDYSASARLQSDIQRLPLHEVQPQRFRVNVDTFRPIYSIACRNNDLGLLKWMLPHFRMARQRKRQDLDYYTAILENPLAPIPSPAYPRDQGGFLREYGFTERSSSKQPQVQNTDGSSSTGIPNEPSVTFFTPSMPSPSSSDASSTSQREEPTPCGLDVSLEPASSSSQSHQDPFDLALHVEVLQRDVTQLKQLDNRIGPAFTRLHIRLKEALGRRIWAGKKIYLRTARRRVKISREAWMDIVNFGGKKPSPASAEPAVNSESSNSSVAS